MTEQKVLNLAYDILRADCFGCNNNCPSQLDHTCILGYYFNWALSDAIEIIKSNTTEDVTNLYEKLSTEEYYI